MRTEQTVRGPWRPATGSRGLGPKKVNTADQKVPRKGWRADMERTIPALPKAPLMRPITAVQPQQPNKKENTPAQPPK